MPHFTNFSADEEPEKRPDLQPIERLTRDVQKALTGEGGPGGVTSNEARYLVDLYYTVQKARIVVNNQVKGLERDAKKSETEPEPHTALDWTLDQFEMQESNIQKLLLFYAGNHPMFWFFEQTTGIGPIISAGLLAHIDIHKAQTAGAIWRFAGLDPTMVWEKKTKRPWNAALKVLCWKMGDSFVKFSGHESCYYGHVYRARKELEVARDEAGLFKDQATKALEGKTFKAIKAKKTYESGHLPAGHLDARARRYAVKLFLSHLHQRWREQEGLPLVKPWVITADNEHTHMLQPPQIRPASAID